MHSKLWNKKKWCNKCMQLDESNYRNFRWVKGLKKHNLTKCTIIKKACKFQIKTAASKGIFTHLLISLFSLYSLILLFYYFSILFSLSRVCSFDNTRQHLLYTKWHVALRTTKKKEGGRKRESSCNLENIK